MNIDFSLWLLILSALSGVIWLFDGVVLARTRRQNVAAFLAGKNIGADEFKGFIDSLDEDGRPQQSTDKPAAKTDVVKQKLMEQALVLHRESVPVEYAKSFFPILFAVLLLRSFLFEPFQIPTGSMIPTLNIGDFIVVNKFAYGLRLPVTGTKILNIGDPKRGDVMVFVPPHEPVYYIKRVIGLPGDTCVMPTTTVYINGEPVPQEVVGPIPELGAQHSMETVGGVTHDIYTDASPRPEGSTWLSPEGVMVPKWLPPEGAVIPAGHYFMMGDNRNNSLDSRFWGPESEEKIVGKAVAVWMHKEAGWHLPSFGENRLIVNPD